MLEASQILDEFPGDMGLLLWQTLRDVTLWAQTPPSGRAGLFSRDTDTSRLAGVLVTVHWAVTVAGEEASRAISRWLVGITNRSS